MTKGPKMDKAMPKLDDGGGSFEKKGGKGGKKFPLPAVVKGLRRKSSDPEADAIIDGGYSKGHGIGSG